MKYFLFLGFLTLSIASNAQCEILNRVYPDGTMVHYIKSVNFYWTSASSLKGGISTDKENYFLELQPIPFPPKSAGVKLNKDLEIKLSDGKTYLLTHYDTRYIQSDTVMKLLYLIEKKDIDLLLKNEVDEAKINMMGTEGIRTYAFKLHRSAIKEQLSCLIKK
jgi:hypothetical protein